MRSISLRIRRALALGLIFFAGAAPIAPVVAQTYPDRSIEIVNSFAPGGSNDLSIRALEAAAILLAVVCAAAIMAVWRCRKSVAVRVGPPNDANS